MAALRRRLASCALAVTLLQCVLLFAAPVSACCGSGNVRQKADAARDAHECCPAGAHAPGQCPLHKTSHSADCAFRCDASHAPDFVLGAMGVLTRPAAVPADRAVTTPPLSPPPAPPAPPPPRSPPPRSPPARPPPTPPHPNPCEAGRRRRAGDRLSLFAGVVS